MKFKNGFTLIELMITVGIVAIMAGIAAPSFLGTITKNRIVTKANEFVLALQIARSEAIKRGTSVNIIATDGTTSTNEWGAGWRVETSDGETIRIFESLEGDITFNSNTDYDEFSFSSQGNIDNTDSLDICEIQTPTGTRIIVTATGRTRIQSDIPCAVAI